MRIPKKIKKQYQEMKSKHPDCLFFFCIGDKYFAFGRDAEIASKLCDGELATTKAKDFTARQFSIPYDWQRCSSYIDKMKLKHRVALCTQIA